MDIKQTSRDSTEMLISQIDLQIASHEQIIRDLKYHREMLLESPVEEHLTIKQDSPLTRDLIRRFLKMYDAPVQTAQAIDLLYDKKTVEEKSKLIKTLSVIFNQMQKEGEIEIKKEKGVKGNFYALKK